MSYYLFRSFQFTSAFQPRNRFHFQPIDNIRSRKTSRDLELWRIWPWSSNLAHAGGVKINQHAKYLGRKSFSSKVIARTNAHTYTGPTARRGPLKWTVIYSRHWSRALPYPSSRQHPGSDDHQEGRVSELFCAVGLLCTTVVHNDTHTRQQF